MEKIISKIITLEVDNEFGVLTRVTALVRRQGWNIKSLAVAATEKKEISRLTINVECLDSSLAYVLSRLKKLDCVKNAVVFMPSEQICREALLIRVTNHGEVLDEAASRFGAKCLSSSEKDTCFELLDNPDKIDRFISLLKPFGILETSRTGVITLGKAEGDK